MCCDNCFRFYRLFSVKAFIRRSAKKTNIRGTLLQILKHICNLNSFTFLQNKIRKSKIYIYKNKWTKWDKIQEMMKQICKLQNTFINSKTNQQIGWTWMTGSQWQVIVLVLLRESLPPKPRKIVNVFPFFFNRLYIQNI